MPEEHHEERSALIMVSAETTRWSMLAISALSTACLVPSSRQNSYNVTRTFPQDASENACFEADTKVGLSTTG